MLDAGVTFLLVASGDDLSHDVLLDIGQVDLTHLSIITVEDLGNLLKGRTAGLDVEDGDEDKLEEDPALDLVSE